MLKLLFQFTIFIVMAFTFNSFKSDNNGDYYYYKNERIYLTKSGSELFFVLKNNMSENDFRNELGDLKEKFNTKDFDTKESMQIVKMNLSANDNNEEIIKQIKSNPAFEYVSPVFRLPEGVGSDKVQLGLINEIIVQFKPGVNATDYIGKNNFTIIEKLDLSGGDTYRLKISSELNPLNVANEIYESGIANYVDPNFFQTNLLNYVPNDQFFSSQWSIKNTGSNIPTGISGTVDCDMDVDSAWDISLGSSAVVVSIVDTGIDTLHPDLSAKIVNGKGYNFYSNNTNSMDDNNHGTCCAGIVGAIGNNSIGVSGIAPNAKLFGIKIFNSSGSTTVAAITNGMIYVKTSGCWVSSHSWGGGSPISAADNAILDAVTTGRGGKGIVFCFATGNGNTSTISWPASNPNVIAVGGISPCNQRKSLSSCDNETWWGANYGTGTTIVAPCTKVYATDRRGSAGYSSTDYYDQFNGTSSATPNTSGVCALVLGLDTNMRWDTLRARVARFADKVGSYTYNQPGSLGIGGWTSQMGYGKINAYRIMKYTLDNMPAAPCIMTVAPEGFYNTGTAALNSKDTVRFYLRNSASPYAVVDSGKAVLDSVNLSAVVIFNNASSGTYYIVANHRNSIETWSKSGGEIYTRGSALNYNFTTASTQAYGSNQVLKGSKYCIYSADVNKDGIVDGTDNLQIDNDASLFLSGYLKTDVDGNYVIDGGDAVIGDNNAKLLVTSVTP